MQLALAGEKRIGGAHGSRALIVLGAALLLVVVAIASPAGATADQASQPSSAAAGQLDAGGQHTCSLVAGDVRCWGLGSSGQLGYGNTDNIGDDETPGTAGPVDLGPGRTATAISAGDFHTCALLDDGSVRCWGFGGSSAERPGGDGRLGYGNANDIGDDETPGSVAPVNLGRPAIAISAGGAHTCAVLDNGSVLCWGFGEDGRLGYGDPATIGDDETPGSLAPVDLGRDRTATATAISAGGSHTCAVLDDRSVRCWGTNGTLFGGDGRLGYGNPNTIGDNETPGSVDPVDLGPGRTATAISAGDFHTCAVLDGGSVRCWGNGVDGRLGYGDERAIGDNEPPSSAGPVVLGGAATAITAGNHTCARLTNGAVRCWGPGSFGRLGYGNTDDIGDNETPSAVGPVVLGGTAKAISAGATHTCAGLDDATLRCWGDGRSGRLGYGSESNIGDDETPGAAGPVDLMTRAPIIGIPRGPGTIIDDGAPAGTPAVPLAVPLDPEAAALRAQAARLRGLRTCLGKVKRHARAEGRRARRLDGPRRARAARHARRHKSRGRRGCLKRWGRTPGRVTGLTARAGSARKVVLKFKAAGTDRSRPPAAHTYVVKQSRRPIRGARGFRRAESLCRGSCRFPTVTRLGDTITLTVTDLRPRTTYHYSVAARDNVSRRPGPRSRATRARTP